MKKLLLSFLFLGTTIGANAQNILFQDNFDSYDDFLITGFGGWQTLDIDGRGTYSGGTEDDPAWENVGTEQAYIIFNPTTALVNNRAVAIPADNEVRNFDPHSGAKYAASWAATPNFVGEVPTNEDWLISPPITLGSAGNELTVWVKSMSSSYGLEQYSIGVHVGADEPFSSDDFEMTFANGLEAPYPNWEEVTVDLNDYAGQVVRIGIRNEGSDHYMFMVDDFKVTTSDLGVKEAIASKFNTYPNPANNVVNVSNNYNILLTNVAINDINGRTVKTLKVNNLSELQMDIAELSAGVYFMNIDTDSGTVVKKFIKS